ncbi:MAG: efflux RND transporter permease subunit [Acidobacteriota bacterium]|nr:efflux RND transporter permease subunit [Acidobacteriota bacterium]
MRALTGILRQRKLVLTLALLLAFLGVASWATMKRQEDPRLPDYWGQVVVTFPGADAETVERLVLDRLEEYLASVAQVGEISSTAYSEVAVLTIDLREDTDDTDGAWDEVREALEDATPELPDGASEPRLNDDLQDQEGIVYALTGHPDPLELKGAADRLKDELLALSVVSKVEIVADPGDQIVVELTASAARRLGVDPRQLAAQLGARNRILPGGSVELSGRNVTLRPQSEFESLDEIRNTPVLLPSGSTVPLSSIATVRRGPEEPVTARMRYDGENAVGLGVVLRTGINVISAGETVRGRMEELRDQVAPVEVTEVAFQPDRVEHRLDELGRSLLLGVMIVAGVLMLTMGLRMGLIVASVVPLVALSALAVYAMGGGVLHQISVAALVIALGMLVDNAIVVAENIQWRLDRGEPSEEAATGAVAELATPLAAATATTLAAFVPMYLAEGGTGEFTRAIPLLIMLTLTVSYLFAVFVTPALSNMLLRPQLSSLNGGPRKGWLERQAPRLGRLAVRRAGWVLLAVAVLVGSSLLAAGWVKQQFFPSSDRNQLVVDLRLPEGSHLDATDRQAQVLERALLAHPEVVSVAGFVGRSTPKFYYNLNTIPWSPHLAQLVVETTSTDSLEEVIHWTRDFVYQELPAVELVVQKLEQGPSIAAPVEIRLYAQELEPLSQAADAVLAELRAIPGAADVRHSLGGGTPMMRFHIEDAAAGRRGMSRDDVALSLFGRTRGLPVGYFRAEDEPVPVVVRSPEGEALPVEDLLSMDISTPGGEPVPLGQLARLELQWRPAAIHHHDGQRVVRVLSQLDGEATYSDVLRQLEPKLQAMDLPAGVSWQFGGAAEGSEEANVAMLRTFPIGVLLLLGILMSEFRSFRRVGIVLVTVPLAAAGVVPGLLVSGQPFGFMSLLGVIALVGVVVNNAIVMLEVVEARRADGEPIPVALIEAVERRLRPILLTTATTVAGLLPLAFSPSTLWPPMAWAMISGLIASTVLTVLVVPALYTLLFVPRRIDFLPQWLRSRRAATAGLLLLALVAAGGAQAQPPMNQSPVMMTLEQAMDAAVQRPRAQAAGDRAEAAGAAARAERRAALLPTVTVGGGVNERDRDLDLVTPIGDISFGDRRSESGEVRVVQPLLDPARLFYAAPAARAEAEAAESQAYRSREEAAAEAAEAFLDVLALDARRQATESFIASLETRLRDTRSRVDAGRALESDALKVQLALDSARQDLLALEQAREVATWALGMAVGADNPVKPRWEPQGKSGWKNEGEGEALAASSAQARGSAPAQQAFEHRQDLAALNQQLNALELRRKAVSAERLPRLDADARWTWTTGSPYREDNWIEAGVLVSWRPFAAATNRPRQRALEAQAQARQRELQEARRGVSLEIRAARAELATARGAVTVGRTGVEQATETLRVERQRYDAGRATTNDLLAAEAALRDEQTRRDLAELDVVRASIRLRLAQGELLGSS